MLYHAFKEDVKNEGGTIVLKKGCTGSLEALPEDAVKELLAKKVVGYVAPFMVVCTCEREVESVVFCDTIELAVETANEKLRSQLGEFCSDDNFDELDEGDEGDDWCKASSDSRNAWCNVGNYNWDAYIVEISE